MATSLHSARYFAGAIVALATTGILTACGGSSPMAPTTSTMQNPAAHAPLFPDVKNHCPAHGGVRVRPCRLTFDASNTGPDTVTVRAPKSKKGTLTELDACGGPSGIATITQGIGDRWTVTAGSASGSCIANFKYANPHGRVVGHAELLITNNL